MFDKQLMQYPEYQTLVDWMERQCTIEELNVLKEAQRGTVEDVRYAAGRVNMCRSLWGVLSRGK